MACDDCKHVSATLERWILAGGQMFLLKPSFCNWTTYSKSLKKLHKRVEAQIISSLFYNNVDLNRTGM